DVDEGLLRFKNTAVVCSFSQLAEALPGLERISLRHRDSYPFCAANIDSIAQALESSPDSVCVEGGPCLFGEHEVMGTVTLRNGEKCYFDYSCGKRYVDSAAGSYTDGLDESESDLASFICTHANEVADVAFTSHKTGLTRQEYLHSVLPFAFAAALDVPLVITLPDMSYRKYLAYVSRLLPEDTAHRVMASFDEVLYAVSDLYLALFERLEQHYQPRRLAVVHNRDQELVRTFERERAPYIERNKVLRNLTANPAKLESIKDYISMPALPLYLFGSNTILEVNSMDEVDSYRKCRKAHKRAAEFGCVLFPEMLSSDGENTLYCAPIRYKEYGDYTHVVGWIEQ
ncbi:MAG: hypothetical protein IJ087_11810, partial [Eggerthellaceae bacterium]|nr:hypothetical protein [Eggerthellaceae bacterium]